jgi:hypothetical protein
VQELFVAAISDCRGKGATSVGPLAVDIVLSLDIF